jgi:hypothetical protein
MKKLQHFKDYYLKTTLIVIVIISALLYILFHSFHNNDSHALRVVIFDNQCSQQEIAQIQKDAGEALRQAGIQDSLVIENNYSSSSSSDLDRFYVLAANKAVDAVIADNDTFQMLAGQGYFTSLDSLDSSSLIYAAGYKDSDQITFEDNETGKGETQPYGIRFGSSVLSFVASSPNETAFQIFNQTLTENDKYAE